MLVEHLVLQFRPFQGDETPVRELADKFLVTRKPHKCQICWGAIEVGQRVRALTELNCEDRQVMTFYFCTECCEAMAASWSDEGEAIEKRYGIGQEIVRRERRA